MKVVMISEEKLDKIRDDLCKDLKLNAHEEYDPEVKACLQEARRKTHYLIHCMVDEIKKG